MLKVFVTADYKSIFTANTSDYQDIMHSFLSHILPVTYFALKKQFLSFWRGKKQFLYKIITTNWYSTRYPDPILRN